MLTEPLSPSQIQAPELNLDSTVMALGLTQFSVELRTTSREVVQRFQTQPQIPGVVLLKNGSFWGMISRSRFWEHMSRPYSLELFLDRSVQTLYPFIESEAIRVDSTTTIVAAAQASLQRPANLLDEPLVIEMAAHQSGAPRYFLLDAHQLLVAASQIHQLTAQLLHESTLQLRLANSELERLATADGLTGIANRRRFDEYFELALTSCRRLRSPLALVIVDVDYFKRYNDSLGHLEGDHCLKAIAQCLHTTLAMNLEHLVARYGGEEFGLVLPHQDAAAVAQVLTQIQTAIAAQNLTHPDSPISPRVTLSLGAVVQVPDDKTTVTQLIKNADRALYAAKQQGRDRYVLNCNGLNCNQAVGVESGAEQS